MNRHYLYAEIDGLQMLGILQPKGTAANSVDNNAINSIVLVEMIGAFLR